MHPDATTVLEFSFLEQAIPDMQRESPAYLAAHQTSKYWNDGKTTTLGSSLPASPASSTAVEEVFSVLRSSFGDDQGSSLEDCYYVTAE